MGAPKDSNFYFSRLARFLSAVSFRLRILRLLEFILSLLASLILVLLGNLWAPLFQDALPYFPFVYTLLALSFVLYVLVQGLGRLAARPSREQVARRVEGKFPQIHDDVTNAIFLFRQLEDPLPPAGISKGFIGAQMRKAAEALAPLSPAQVIGFRAVWKQMRMVFPLAIAFGTVLILDPGFLQGSVFSLLHPFSTLPIKETVIHLEPKDSILLRGSPVTIQAQAQGNVPNRLSLAMWPEGREEIRLPMESEGQGRFFYRLAQAHRSFRYRAENGQVASPTYSIQVVDPPDVEKVRLLLTPPDYTGLPTEVKEEGHIQALKGTLVSLEAQATKDLRDGRMVFSPEHSLPLKITGRRLLGSFLIFYPGSYSLRVVDDLGFGNSNPVSYPIQVIPDQYPRGEIISPAQDIEVGGAEILPITYTAGDDFGLTAVKLSFQVGGKENFIHLKKPNGERALDLEVFQWDLGSLPLTAGDRVICRLAVWDNDTISGPKVSFSPSFTLLIRDEKARAAQEGEEAQGIADLLLNLLGDHLEGKADGEVLEKKLGEVLTRVDRRLGSREDRINRFEGEALKRNLTSLKERMGKESPEAITQELERLALLAEDAAQKAKMNEIEALARELKNRQRRLLDSLNELKGPLTREEMEAVLKELKKLEDLIRSVMDALSQMAAGLPDDFVNNPELQGLDFQDLFQELGEVRKKLMAGDLQGALEAAQRLLQSLSEMMATLGRAGARAQTSAYSRLQGEMRQQAGELDKILSEQEEILRGTEAIHKELKAQVDEEARKRLRQSMTGLMEALERLKGRLPPEQEDSIEKLKRLLEDGQLEKWAEALNGFGKEFPGEGEERKSIRDLERIIKGLRPLEQELLTPAEKEKLSGLFSRQDQLKERTDGLREKLEMLAQLFPGMDTAILHDLKEATRSMGEAARKLHDENAPGAIPPEEEALRGLSRSQQAMQQMAQQMARQMQMARWGYPLAYDPRPGWYYGPWGSLPTLPQPEVKRPIEKGYTGMDREEFELPGKESYQVPRMFREKITEALKEEVPSSYRREVEKYFRGLTE